MATTIVSNLAVFSDATGHGNQSHLVFAKVQQRWWLFIFKTQTANVVSTYVSSSADLTTATWSASTDSPTLTQANSTNDQRNLGVVYLQIGTTDAVHVDCTTCASTAAGAAARTAHIRATFTGTNSITWESWNETVTTLAGLSPKLYKGNTLAISTNGIVHKCQNSIANTGTNSTGDPLAAISTNADTTASWTNGFGSSVTPDDGMAFTCNIYAIAPLNSAQMILVYENASVSDDNSGGLKYSLYVNATTWPSNTGSADVGIGTSTQDQNDWCLCAVDTTHIYAIRRDSPSTYLWRVYNGASWSTPTNPVPDQAHKAISGLFASTNGTDFWLFVLDSASNNPLMYVKCSNAYGPTPSWSGWTQLEPADTAARNFISGCPYVGNNQIGIIYTRVNGSNFDIIVTALKLFPSVPTAGTRTRTRAKESKRYRPR